MQGYKLNVVQFLAHLVLSDVEHVSSFEQHLFRVFASATLVIFKELV